MKSRFLSGQVSLRRAVFLNVVTTAVVAVLVAGVATVGAATLDAFRPSGTIRLATATKSAGVSVHGSDGSTKVMSVQFTVPSGRKADIAATYSGQLQSNDVGTSSGLCFGSMRLDNEAGPDLAPGKVLLLTKGVSVAGGGFYTENRTFQAVKNGIGFGSHTLFIIADTGGGGCTYSLNSLSVVADIH